MWATAPKTAWSSFTGKTGLERTAKPPIRTVGVLSRPIRTRCPDRALRPVRGGNGTSVSGQHETALPVGRSDGVF